MEPSFTRGLPRPSRPLWGLLLSLLAFGLSQAFLGTWVSGGQKLFGALVWDSERFMHGEVWRIVSSGLLTSPANKGHLLFSVVALYFFAPDLERRWGIVRYVAFFFASVVAGNLLVLLFDRAMPETFARFHASLAFGPYAAVLATTAAWARFHEKAQVYLLVFPVRGVVLYWIDVGLCVLSLIYPDAVEEGVVAPFAGLLVGTLCSGAPPPIRVVWLRLKLAWLRRKGAALSSDDLLREIPPSRKRKGPDLRVLEGGGDGPLFGIRKNPKDKKYLH